MTRTMRFAPESHSNKRAVWDTCGISDLINIVSIVKCALCCDINKEHFNRK